MGTTGEPAAGSLPEEADVESKVTIMVEIMDWFRENEDDLDTAINAALREHIERKRQES